MKDNSRKLATFVIAIIVVYLGAGLLGILPDNVDFINSTSTADEVAFVEYDVPTAYSGISFSMTYNTHDNNIYFTEDNANKIGKMTQSGTFDEYSIPSGTSNPRGLEFNPYDDCIYSHGRFSSKVLKMTETGTYTQLNSLGVFSNGATYNSNDQCIYYTINDGRIIKIKQDFTLSLVGTYTSAVSTLDITFNTHDGFLYFGDFSNKIVKMSPVDGTYTAYSIPTSDAQPVRICYNSHDNCVYFVEQNVNKIGKMTEDGTMSEFTLPTTNSYPNDIVFNEDDNCVYVSEKLGNKVAKMTESGEITEYSIPTEPSPSHSIIALCYNNYKIYYMKYNTNIPSGGLNRIGIMSLPEPEPPIEPTGDEETSEIIVEIEQAGEWSSANPDGVTNLVGDDITIQTHIESEDEIDNAEIIYSALNTGNGEGSVEMSLTDGTETDGTWTGVIPAQNNEGSITFYIHVETETGETYNTVPTEMLIEGGGGVTPTVTPNVNTTSMAIYSFGIVGLTLIAMYINRPR